MSCISILTCQRENLRSKEQLDLLKTLYPWFTFWMTKYKSEEKHKRIVFELIIETNHFSFSLIIQKQKNKANLLHRDLHSILLYIDQLTHKITTHVFTI
jgi:hypothetical protein